MIYVLLIAAAAAFFLLKGKKPGGLIPDSPLAVNSPIMHKASTPAERVEILQKRGKVVPDMTPTPFGGVKVVSQPVYTKPSFVRSDVPEPEFVHTVTPSPVPYVQPKVETKSFPKLPYSPKIGFATYIDRFSAAK